MSYIDNIDSRISEIAKGETLYKNRKCEEIIRKRIDQNFFIEESSLELPLQEKLILDDSNNSFKWVSVGYPSVGKTSLLLKVDDDEYDNGRIRYFENYCKVGRMPCIVDGIKFLSEFRCDMCDTSDCNLAGQGDYDRVRPLSYPGTSLFTMLYAIDSVPSLKYLAEHYLWECSQCAPDATLVVLSTKNDLSSTFGMSDFELYWNNLFNPDARRFISREEGIKFSKAIGAVAFFETSAKYDPRYLDVKLAKIRHLHLKYLETFKTKARKNCTLQ